MFPGVDARNVRRPGISVRLGMTSCHSKLARGLIQAFDEPSLGAFESLVVAQGSIVRADVDAAVGDRGIPIGGGSHLGDPADISGGCGSISPPTLLPRVKESGRSLSADTRFRSSVPPHCGQSAPQVTVPRHIMSTMARENVSMVRNISCLRFQLPSTCHPEIYTREAILSRPSILPGFWPQGACHQANDWHAVRRVDIMRPDLGLGEQAGERTRDPQDAQRPGSLNNIRWAVGGRSVFNSHMRFRDDHLRVLRIR